MEAVIKKQLNQLGPTTRSRSRVQMTRLTYKGTLPQTSIKPEVSDESLVIGDGIKLL